MKQIEYIAFSDRGLALAVRLAAECGGHAIRCEGSGFLDHWTSDAFSSADALVFVGAAGIAVRAIAPFVHSKLSDPAVIVIDELGLHAIPILSGHLGGANRLARQLAACCGAEAVITTATDINGVFAVDCWADSADCAIRNPERIRDVSSRLLAGAVLRLHTEYPITGLIPSGIVLSDKDPDIQISVWDRSVFGLFLIPRILTLGIGCRKGSSADQLEAAFACFCRETGICPEGFCRAASIDLKKDEPGLLEFCQNHKIPFLTYAAEELSHVEGSFTASEFVRSVTGIDNVCERSAVLGSRGKLLISKHKYDGVTFAAAETVYTPDWSY